MTAHGPRLPRRRWRAASDLGGAVSCSFLDHPRVGVKIGQGSGQVLIRIHRIQLRATAGAAFVGDVRHPSILVREAGVLGGS